MLTDPQIVDSHTYPGRPKALQKITEYISDLYLRRNWVNVNKVLDSDANVFMGDLFDGGREWTDREWRQEFKRFSRIFNKPAYKKTLMGLPGNHDIGFGNTVVYHALQRFGMYFGEPSSTHIIGNHTFVFLDTISLMNTENKTIYAPPEEFMQTVADAPEFETYPRVLLTHVPLYRDAELSCGPNRESKRPIPFTYGYQYQTLISPEISDWVLKYMRPSVVFSGDDHDACFVEHSYNVETTGGGELTMKAQEYTVKSPSLAMGVSRPAIQLLSLLNDPTTRTTQAVNSKSAQTQLGYGQGETYQTKICFLPSPFYAIILYTIFALFSLSVILIVNFLPVLFPRSVTHVLGKHKWSRHRPAGTFSVDSPATPFGKPLLPAYETEEEHTYSASGKDKDVRKQDRDTVLWRARLLTKQPKIWLKIVVDVAMIVGWSLAVFMFLGWSIYHN